MVLLSLIALYDTGKKSLLLLSSTFQTPIFSWHSKKLLLNLRFLPLTLILYQVNVLQIIFFSSLSFFFFSSVYFQVFRSLLKTGFLCFVDDTFALHFYCLAFSTVNLVRLSFGLNGARKLC